MTRLYAVLFASTCVVVGVLWDISWHVSIGRDSFWTPAHMAIYLGGVIAGLTCGWLALHVTFAGSPDERAQAVSFWRVFRAPIGAWVCIWGTIAMLTSAPFDDWWHNAYGLDVKILSPPHVLLAVGIGAISYGAMLMAAAHRNRLAGTGTRLDFLYLYSAALLLVNASTLGTDYFGRWHMHQSFFYAVCCLVFPFLLVGPARAVASGRVRWPATTVAAIFMLIRMALMWILPLFPAEPGLGPIYVHVDRFLPPDFPLLLIVPAIAIDLLLRRLEGRKDWQVAFVIAPVFLVTLLAVQWPFAEFLTTTWARNMFFAAHRMSYMVPPEIQERWYQLNPADNLMRGLPIALVLAFLSLWRGLKWGGMMGQVRR